jgi:hypothetical protein
MAKLINTIIANGKINREDAVTVAQRLDRAGVVRFNGEWATAPETFLQGEAIRKILRTGIVW